jgi:hypothetical protein
MENLQKYFIRSSHEIYEDSYIHGEGKNINFFNNESEILANSPIQALEKYSSRILGYDLDAENLDHENTGFFYANFLVDKDCFPAPAEDVEKWKKEQIMLYSDNINFEIYELIKIITL